MTNAQPRILATDIHSKWEKISDQEAGSVKKSDDLVALVKAKYSLSQEQAQTDVTAWANGRSF
jgi:hypothetical protein